MNLPCIPISKRQVNDMGRAALIGLFFFIFLLESSFLPVFFNGIWQMDLWLALIGVSVLVLPRRYSVWFSVIGGISRDLITGNFFGLHLISYLAVAFLLTAFMKEKYNRHWYVSVAVVTIGTILSSLLSAMVLYAGYKVFPGFVYALSVMLPMIVLNAAGAIIFHHLLWSIRYEGEPRW